MRYRFIEFIDEGSRTAYRYWEGHSLNDMNRNDEFTKTTIKKFSINEPVEGGYLFQVDPGPFYWIKHKNRNYLKTNAWRGGENYIFQKIE
jgi:hypothetical protein